MAKLQLNYNNNNMLVNENTADANTNMLYISTYLCRK